MLSSINSQPFKLSRPHMPQVDQGKERLNCSVQPEWRSDREATQPLLITLKSRLNGFSTGEVWKRPKAGLMRKSAFSQGIFFLLLFPCPQILSCLQPPLPHPTSASITPVSTPPHPREMCQAPIRQTQLHKCTLSPNEQKYSNLKMYIKCL